MDVPDIGKHPLLLHNILAIWRYKQITNSSVFSVFTSSAKTSRNVILVNLSILVELAVEVYKISRMARRQMESPINASSLAQAQRIALQVPRLVLSLTIARQGSLSKRTFLGGLVKIQTKSKVACKLEEMHRDIVGDHRFS